MHLEGPSGQVTADGESPKTVVGRRSQAFSPGEGPPTASRLKRRAKHVSNLQSPPVSEQTATASGDYGHSSSRDLCQSEVLN
jgi:hypothetical protein